MGKNLAIRLPGEIVRVTGLSNGERLDIETHAGEIVIRRAVPGFTLEELFRGKNPEEWLAAYAGAVDWGSMSAVRSSRNDGLGLFARHRRSYLNDRPGPG
jgi:antitoxin component of MazEF toxin-antitoxin module